MNLAGPAILAMLLLGNGIPSSAQDASPVPQPQTDPSGTYADSKESLQSFLEELLAATKAKDRERVTALVKKTEIPHARAWFQSMYPSDKLDSWIEPYERNLSRDETALQQFFERISASGGQFLIRKQSDVPKPNNSLVWAMLDDPNPSSDAYLATWKSAASDDPRPQFIGFFYYIDGAFRWNSVVHFEPRQPATGSASNPDAAHQTVAGPIEQIGKGISPPRVIHLEGAHYSPTAEKARFEGTVILSLVVDTDGLPKQIKVTRSLGMGLDEKAVEAVRQYTFEPARNSKGEPVAVAVAIEVRFKLYK